MWVLQHILNIPRVFLLYTGFCSQASNDFKIEAVMNSTCVYFRLLLLTVSSNASEHTFTTVLIAVSILPLTFHYTITQFRSYLNLINVYV